MHTPLMGPDLWAFVIVTLVAIVLFVLALCEASSGADDAVEEMLRERAIREMRERGAGR